MIETPKKKKILKNNISNIDIFVLAYEINQILQDGFIQNVYEISESRILILKCRTKDGKRNIIIDPKSRINFTQFDYPVPPYPTQFIMALRKFIKGRRVTRVYQHKLDRIIIIELKSSEGEPWKFIIEFFGGGNFILVNGEDKTYMAKSYRKMRDREILAKHPYQFPPSRGIDLWELTWDTYLEHLNPAEGELVRTIARSFNVGGYISEEICLRSNINKKTKIQDLNEEELKKVYDVMQDLISALQLHQYSPRILLNDDNEPIGFEPLNYDLYSSYKFDSKNSFNEAIDDYFSKFDSEMLFSGEVKESKGVLTKTEKILQKQIEKIDDSKIKREESLSQGHLIYQYLYDIDQLISIIMTQKRENKRSWKEISSILNQGKVQNIRECLLFEKIYPQEVKLEINIEGNLFKLDLKKTAIQNADMIYKQAQKAKRKIAGALKAAEDTKKKIELQKAEHDEILAQKATLLKKPPTKWYHKYRWFISTNGFLIVGGRDASSNEILVKKYMKPNDLFFHTEARGSSVCIIQNEENKEIPEKTIKETSVFGSCYSSAWKNGWGNAEIYYVTPDQVSKTPKSGEYLKKGSFYITGKKHSLPKPYLELSIGVKLIPVNLTKTNDEEDIETDKEKIENTMNNQESSIKDQLTEDGEQIQFYPQVISAPLSAITAQTKNFVIIKPLKGGKSTSDLAKKILKQLIAKADEIERPWIALTSINDLIRVIPSGGSEITEKRK